MKILNLYAGIGGNRKLWQGHEITAVEINQKIANQYALFYPEDKIIVTDAHEYLLQHFHEFDFIWSSPPCQKNSRFIRSGKNRKPSYPDLTLYSQVIFLKHNFPGSWIIENVIPYYKPLIHAQKLGRHLYWANFKIQPFKEPKPPINFINHDSPLAVQALKHWLNIHYPGNIYSNSHSPAQVLRNCVHPATGLHILNCAIHQHSRLSTIV